MSKNKIRKILRYLVIFIIILCCFTFFTKVPVAKTTDTDEMSSTSETTYVEEDGKELNLKHFRGSYIEPVVSEITTTIETLHIIDGIEENTVVSSKQTSTYTTEITITECVENTNVLTEPLIVYKPSTHYFHLNSCKWYDPKTCVTEWNINEVEGRICSKCKPDIELVNIYTPSTVTTKSNSSGTYTMSNLPVSQSDFYMLANLVAHEYGADWVSEYEKAKVVMTVMNRVRSDRYPNTISAVILQRNQYCWVPNSYYWNRTTQSCKDAVLYYFNNQTQYSTNLFSFWGDGRVNHFY